MVDIVILFGVNFDSLLVFTKALISSKGFHLLFFGNYWFPRDLLPEYGTGWCKIIFIQNKLNAFSWNIFFIFITQIVWEIFLKRVANWLPVLWKAMKLKSEEKFNDITRDLNSYQE